MPRPLTVEFTTETTLAAYYRVSAGKDGGPMVSVRIGAHRIPCCLTCIKTDCAHARAAEDYARERRAREKAAA